ncbi:MAG: glycosyltransferase family 39 protein [Candidatus Omnitrophica bacterium]|nr:glycosyltransferase family 39 protein [Candidatus Omnitrophota bacterium]
MKNNNFNYLSILLWMAGLFTFAVTRAPGGLDVDACNYAVVAKEVLRSGHWLGIFDPVYQGVFYYHFPLTIWITALIFKLFGVSAFTAALFSMLCNLVLVAVLFYFGKILKNSWVGFFAALSFLLTNHVIRLAMQARMDIPVSLFITLAILSFILAEKRSRAYYLLFGLFSCLAIFAKDVNGLAPLGIVFIYLVLRRKWKEFFHPLFISGILVTFTPVVLWIWLDKNTLFNAWWNWNFLHLLSSKTFSVPWYYYILALLKKYFYFLPFVIYGGYLGIKEAREKKNFDSLLLVVWAIFFPFVYSFGRQKLHYFILPIYPATSLLAGLAFDRILKEPIKQKVFTGLRYVLIIASAVFLFLPLNLQSKRFIEAVKICPVIDQTLKGLPDYDFIVYKYDTAAILFYSQQLKKIQPLNELPVLVKELSLKSPKPRFIFISEDDFLQLGPAEIKDFRVLLKYKHRLVVTDLQGPQSRVSLP